MSDTLSPDVDAPLALERDVRPLPEPLPEAERKAQAERLLETWETPKGLRYWSAVNNTEVGVWYTAVVRAPDNPQMEQDYFLQYRLVRSSLFQLDTMEVLVSLLASGACERFRDFKFVLGESGVTWLPYVFDRLDTEYYDRTRGLNFSLKPSDYFRRQGYVTYQQDQFLEPIVPLIGEDNIIWGADYPHPDCLWPESRLILDKNLSGFPERVRRKITCENVAKLYGI